MKKIMLGKLNTLDEHIVQILLLAVVLIPVQTVISTWLGSNFGNLLVFRLVPDMILFSTTLLISVRLIQDKKIREQFFSNTLVRLVLAFGFLHGLLLVLMRPDIDAAAAAVIINMRYFVVLIAGLYVQIAVSRKQLKQVLDLVLKAVLTGAAIIIAFGFMQATILPDDFLSLFGYSDATTAPFITLDSDSSLVRTQSTLRGPNPLGAYLVMPLLFFIYKSYKDRSKKLALLSVAGIFVLYTTYSRSAWIGFAVGVALLMLLEIKNKRLLMKYGAVSLLLVLSVGLLVLRSGSSDTINRIIFHDESGQVLTESNREHIRSITTSAEQVVSDPLGDGPGTAGPASFHNDDRTRISENYFLQIAQEVGIIGLGLLLSVLWITVKKLQNTSYIYRNILISAVVGISVVNLFSHAWTDPAVVVSWWAIVSLIIPLEQRRLS